MLIKESALRRIIREEARRSLREAADSETVPGAGAGVGTPMSLVNMASDTASTFQTANGQRFTGLTQRNDPVSTYKANAGAVLEKVTAAVNALPGGSTGGPGAAVMGGYYSFQKQGSKSSMAQLITDLKNSTISPAGIARSILAIFAGDADPSASTDKAGGMKLGLGASATAIKKVDAAIGDPAEFYEKVFAMASFDVAAKTQILLAQDRAPGKVTPLSGETSASIPASTEPVSSQSTTNSWNTYLAKNAKNGLAVKTAWEAYARSSGSKTDFLSFARWWQARKKQNPSWKGDSAATISYLSSMTRAGGSLVLDDVYNMQ